MKELQLIEKKIEMVKRELMSLGEMQPGSLSQQYNVCGMQNCHCKDPKNPKKNGPYYQLSFTARGKSTTRFIKKENVDVCKDHISNYKRFVALTKGWKELAAAQVKMRLDLEKAKA